MTKAVGSLGECSELLASGRPLEEVLTCLRRAGLDKTDSMRFLSEAGGKSLDEAKKLVHFSATWADLRPAHDRFHKRLLTELQRINDQAPE